MRREVVAALLVVLLAGAGVSWLAWQLLAPRTTETSPTDTVASQVEEDGAPEQDVEQNPELVAVGPEREHQPELLGPSEDQPGSIQPIRDPDGGIVIGRVVNPEHKVVEGAQVELFKGPASLMSEPSLRKPTGISALADSNGMFRLEGVPPSREYILVASHAEYSDAFVGPLRVQALQPNDLGDVLLPDAIRVYGTVRGNGRNLEGALVNLSTQLLRPQGSDDDAAADALQLSMTTRVDGSFEFRFVPVQTFDISVEAEGYGSQTRSSNAMFAAPSDQELEFDLSPAMTIAGQVTDHQGTPLPNAVVDASLAGETYRCEGQSTTGADGYFFMNSLSQGFYHLNISCDGYSNQTMPRVEAGTVTVQVQLEPRCSLSGTVVDGRNGAPVPRFTLFVAREMNGRPPVRLPGRHRFDSADGSFQIDNLDPNKYVIEAWAPRFAPSFSEPILLERGSHLEGVEVAMNRGGSVSGRVVDGRNQPLADVEVLVLENEYKWNPITDLMEQMAPNASLRRTARTNEKGEFLVELIVPGIYQIAARHPDLADGAQNDVEVLQDQVSVIEDLMLLQGATVEGFTRNENGLPLPGATVNANSDQSDFFQGRSDPQGYYRLAGLTPGNYTVSIGQYQSTPPENVLLQLVKARNSAQTVTLQEGQVLKLDLQLKPVEQR